MPISTNDLEAIIDSHPLDSTIKYCTNCGKSIADSDEWICSFGGIHACSDKCLLKAFEERKDIWTQRIKLIKVE